MNFNQPAHLRMNFLLQAATSMQANTSSANSNHQESSSTARFIQDLSQFYVTVARRVSRKTTNRMYIYPDLFACKSYALSIKPFRSSLVKKSLICGRCNAPLIAGLNFGKRIRRKSKLSSNIIIDNASNKRVAPRVHRQQFCSQCKLLASTPKAHPLGGGENAEANK